MPGADKNAPKSTGPRVHDSMNPRVNGSSGQWINGSTGERAHGSMSPRVNGSTGHEIGLGGRFGAQPLLDNTEYSSNTTWVHSGTRTRKRCAETKQPDCPASRTRTANTTYSLHCGTTRVAGLVHLRSSVSDVAQLVLEGRLDGLQARWSQ